MRRECRERFPRHRLQRKPLVTDPGMHHGTCLTHVPWCNSGSLTRGGGENVPGIPGACATHNFTYLARGPMRVRVTGGRLNKKNTLSYQYRNSPYKDKTVSQSYLYNGNHIPAKTVFILKQGPGRFRVVSLSGGHQFKIVTFPNGVISDFRKVSLKPVAASHSYLTCVINTG